MRAALVINPGARRGDTSPTTIVDCLRRHGVEADPIPVGADGVGAALRTALTTGHDVVIVGGGDGTLSAAADVLRGHAVRLGILPLGTANDFARSLNIPEDVEAACAVVAAGATAAVDVGVANGRGFLNVASIGLPATVASLLTPALKRRWGVLAYAMAAAQATMRQRPFSATLTVDGRRRHVRWVMQAAIGSGRYYGGGLSVTDAARSTDGYLSVHVITAPNVFALLWTLRHLRSGRYARGDSALRFRARDVRVTTRRPRGVDVDGEVAGRTPLHVEVRPRCVEVFAPQRPEPGADAV